MRDIAREAGVSQSTVSRVLNDAPTRVPIAAETRERVLVASRRLGYRPNPHARSLRGASTMLIGAVVRDFSDPFFATVIEALAVEAMARGYNVVIGHAHGRVDEGIALTSVLETRYTDAIVMLGDMQDQPRLLDDLRNSSVPVVATWQGTSPREFPTVDVDERAGIVAGLEHLIALGHRRIGFVSGRLPGDNWQRQDAFIEVMTDAHRRRPGRLSPGRRQQPGRRRGGAQRPAGPGRPTDRRRHLDRPRRRRRPPCRLQPRADGARRAVGRRLRRPAPGGAHGACPDDGADADRRDRPRERRARDLARARPDASREPRVRVYEPTLVIRQSTAPPRPDRRLTVRAQSSSERGIQTRIASTVRFAQVK